jgi:Zn-finger nucleic acid-binding protein
VCKEEMIILEFEDVELDYCVVCHGNWLDQGELEAIIDAEQIIDLSDLSTHRKSKRRCPRCNKKMTTSIFPDSETEVDICPRDGGIWLDRGEVMAIAGNKASENSLIKIQNFFAELYEKEE